MKKRHINQFNFYWMIFLILIFLLGLPSDKSFAQEIKTGKDEFDKLFTLVEEKHYPTNLRLDILVKPSEIEDNVFIARKNSDRGIVKIDLNKKQVTDIDVSKIVPGISNLILWHATYKNKYIGLFLNSNLSLGIFDTKMKLLRLITDTSIRPGEVFHFFNDELIVSAITKGVSIRPAEQMPSIEIFSLKTGETRTIEMLNENYHFFLDIANPSDQGVIFTKVNENTLAVNIVYQPFVTFYELPSGKKLSRTNFEPDYFIGYDTTKVMIKEVGVDLQKAANFIFETKANKFQPIHTIAINDSVVMVQYFKYDLDHERLASENLTRYDISSFKMFWEYTLAELGIEFYTTNGKHIGESTFITYKHLADEDFNVKNPLFHLYKDGLLYRISRITKGNKSDVIVRKWKLNAFD